MRRFGGTRFKLYLGGGIILAICVVALFAPYVAPYDPYQQSLVRRLKPPAFMAGGTVRNLLGTDNYGRDLLSRLIYGSRTSIMVYGRHTTAERSAMSQPLRKVSRRLRPRAMVFGPAGL